MAEVEMAKFVLDKMSPELERLREINDELRNKLEYAYRCIEHGYVYGTFDFSLLRTYASNYLAELEEKP
jgi:hypothetical protein